MAKDGARLVVTGTGFGAAIVNVCAFDVPPPGAAVNTLTATVAALAMSGPAIAAVNWVAETKVVALSVPFQRTVEPFTKFVPFTVSVNAAPPATAEAGARLDVAGRGFGGCVIVNVCAFDVPPPGAGVKTVTVALPCAAISAAVMFARNSVADMSEVVRFAPFQRTVEPLTKFVPFTVNVNAALPAAVEVGESPVVTGTGAGVVVGLTCKNDATDGTPRPLIKNTM